MTTETLDLACELIARRSLTPDDAGCCELIGARLEKLGFEIEWLGLEGVTNLWATWGNSGPMVVLAGHTDVVPPGPASEWNSDPFVPDIRDGFLHGRGAADMKSGLAAMVVAVESLLARSQPAGRIAFLITSDEEGTCRHGTRHVAEVLKHRGVKPDYAIVGEATASEALGDRIVVGRRGSLGCNLKVIGVQGHVAYPHKADNPIHRLAPALAELSGQRWDDGDAHFPPTSFQISNFNAGTGANNVIPGSADVIFNFRYNPASSAASLKARVTEILDRHLSRYEADWWHSGEPYLTRPGRLIETALASVREVTGLDAQTFTGGGTSDGRFIAPLGTEVVEIGPVNASIHRVNEHIRLTDLERLPLIYERILTTLLA
jgi:succinyl-diaminopimelate desuccinylase